MKTLIIDDSSAMRRIIARTMKSIGFEIVEAGDGRAGLELLAEHNQDIEVILVDWNMPVMNGLQFVERVRANDATKHHKIVMVTTETESVRMARALLAGVDEFVMKPFTQDILIEKLQLIGVQSPIQEPT